MHAELLSFSLFTLFLEEFNLLYLNFIWKPKNILRKWPSGYDVGQKIGLRIRRSWVQAPSTTIIFVSDIFLITIFMVFSPS